MVKHGRIKLVLSGYIESWAPWTPQFVCLMQGFAGLRPAFQLATNLSVYQFNLKVDTGPELSFRTKVTIRSCNDASVGYPVAYLSRESKAKIELLSSLRTIDARKNPAIYPKDYPVEELAGTSKSYDRETCVNVCRRNLIPPFR